jgi:hypothetical protein
MKYIENLADNYPNKKSSTKQMDLVLEGGVFNGSYQLGGLLLLKEFEKRKYIKIKRISGASIGSVMGFYYLINKLEKWGEDAKKLRHFFKKNMHFSYLKQIITNHLNELSNKEFEKIKKNKLFISYTNVRQSKRIIKSEFKSKIDLRNTILKSCHLPKFTSSEYFLEKKNELFFDGGFPFIFKNRSLNDDKILYMSLSHYSMLKNMFNSKNEENVYGRILEGILDTYKFFTYEKTTTMCSYVNNWKINDFLILNIKEIFYKIIFYFFVLSYHINKKLLPYIEDTIMYKDFSPIFKKLAENIILLYCI